MPISDRCSGQQGGGHGRSRRRTGRLPALVSVAVLIAVGGDMAASHEAERPPPAINEPGLTTAPRLLRIKPARDFALRDAKGDPVRLSALRGRVVLMSFIYTSCPSACPLLTQRMAVVQDRLMASRAWGGNVAFLSITIDPQRDSAEALNAYADRFGADAQGWRFLREAPEQLSPVLATYGEWTRPLPDGEIDHPARVYLIDRHGEVREIYGLSFFDERQVFFDIRSLLAEPA